MKWIFLLTLTFGLSVQAESFRDYAKVTHVEPIVETVDEPVLERICPAAPTSASLIQDMRNQINRWRHCEEVARYRPRVRTTGYRITYRYGGQLQVTERREYPGDSIAVNVSLDPLAW